MWPVNAKKVIDKMAKYMRQSTPEPQNKPTLPVFQRTPRTSHETRAKWSSLESKTQDQLSSPSRTQFSSLYRGLDAVLGDGDITHVEPDMLYNWITEYTRKLPTSRKRVQKGVN
jgi:hypothetical protein